MESRTITVNGKAMEAGCYANSGFGWNHVRDVLAGLCEDIGRKDLAEELRAEMSDDAGEEYDALDALDDVTVGGSWEFDGERGGLFLDATRFVTAPDPIGIITSPRRLDRPRHPRRVPNNRPHSLPQRHEDSPSQSRSTQTPNAQPPDRLLPLSPSL